LLKLRNCYSLIGAQKSPVLKPGMNARRLSAEALVADHPEKKPRALARGDSLSRPAFATGGQEEKICQR
jgi:hypothetical protein